MPCCASLEDAVDVAMLFCEVFVQTKTLPLLVLDFTSLTYNNRNMLRFEGLPLNSIC